MPHTVICTIPEELSPESDPTGVLAALRDAEYPLAQFLTDDSPHPFDLEVTHEGESEFSRYADLPMEIVSLNAAGCLLRYQLFTEKRNQDDPTANIRLEVYEIGLIFLPTSQILSITPTSSDNFFDHIFDMAVLGVKFIDDDDDDDDDFSDNETEA